MESLFKWYPFKLTKHYPLKVIKHTIGNVIETRLIFPLIGRYENNDPIGPRYDYGIWYPFKAVVTKLDGEVITTIGRRGLFVSRNFNWKFWRPYDY